MRTTWIVRGTWNWNKTAIVAEVWLGVGRTNPVTHWPAKLLYLFASNGTDTMKDKLVETSNQAGPQPQPAFNPTGLWTPKQAAIRANYQSPVSILRAFRRGESARLQIECAGRTL